MKIKLSNMQADRQILNLRCAARALGVRPQNLEDAARQNLVPSVRIGDEYVFAMRELEAALIKGARA